MRACIQTQIKTLSGWQSNQGVPSDSSVQESSIQTWMGFDTEHLSVAQHHQDELAAEKLSPAARVTEPRDAAERTGNTTKEQDPRTAQHIPVCVMR